IVLSSLSGGNARCPADSPERHAGPKAVVAGQGPAPRRCTPIASAWLSFLIEQGGSADALALVDYQRDSLRGGDVGEGIAVYQQQVRFVACFDRADPVIRAQEAGCVVCGCLERYCGRNAGLYP